MKVTPVVVLLPMEAVEELSRLAASAPSPTGPARDQMQANGWAMRDLIGGAILARALTAVQPEDALP